jgi:DNA-binding XRE family transcriptional regulator
MNRKPKQNNGSFEATPHCSSGTLAGTCSLARTVPGTEGSSVRISQHPQVALGRAIRLRREAIGLTQEALADAADLDATSIRGLERGIDGALSTVSHGPSGSPFTSWRSTPTSSRPATVNPPTGRCSELAAANDVGGGASPWAWRGRP